jgi:hypothetical protein
LQYLEANEVLDLKCTTLKKDAKMYRDRMEGILKQMDEVIRERDKVNMVVILGPCHMRTSLTWWQILTSPFTLSPIGINARLSEHSSDG